VSQSAEGLNIVLDGTIRKIIQSKEFIEKLLSKTTEREKAGY
jgi:hypothetical protein